MDQHLADCPDCQALYDDLNRVHQTLQGLPTVAVPAGLTDRVMAAVRSDNVIPLPVKRPATQWKRWAATAAVLALILAGAGGMRLLTGSDILSPASKEMATPEAADPALTRSLPSPTQTEAVDLPTDDPQTVTEDDQSPVTKETVTTQGTTPVSTPEPTTAPVQPTPEPTNEIATMSVPSTSPVESPEESEENPTGSLWMGQMPVIPVPSASATPDGQEDETLEVGVMSVSLEPEVTEEALAAMDRLRLYLELPEDYVWEDGTTALWADGETVLRLTYLGLDSTEQCHMFDFSGTSILYLVPVDGGEIITAQP